ncbi:MAG: SCO family protein [Gammaproteobacteria bacterium]|nr:SCO family protein [Gammaproteobacteria bacterium]
MKQIIIVLLFLCIQGTYASVPDVQKKSVGGDFQLTDQNNQAFDLKQLRGKVVMIFFGYTSCPEVCPTELSKMVSTLKELGEDSNQVQAVFISVDPERDSVSKINEYLNAFQSNLIGLTGTKNEIDQVTKQYQVSYKAMKMMGEDYHVQHNADIFVLNTKGELSTIVPYGMPYNHVTKVVKSVLKQKIN